MAFVRNMSLCPQDRFCLTIRKKQINQIFGAPEIERVLKCSTSTAKNVMKKLREIGVVEEMKGKGKGKYTFISEFNYTKNVN